MYAEVANSKVPIKMSQIVATLKIMPVTLDVDLSIVQNKAEEEIKRFAGDTEIKSQQEPIAFGLKAIKIMFLMDENKGSTEVLEQNIKNIDGVNSAEIVDVRRTVG